MNQLIKGILFGIPLGMLLSVCGLLMGMNTKFLFFALALYSMLTIIDWVVRVQNEKKNEST